MIRVNVWNMAIVGVIAVASVMLYDMFVAGHSVAGIVIPKA